ncbi:hypothetical protein LNV09_20260 [Paucibacter sp. B2R-40]|uniref:hypothetical protein n=1 Tax=Paucibacter sp. B2R-40 TaxID=2893554 RepID=UPI0021E506CB|nr:hypothetical protein [Paucibacter sp. B2R-40]MCV2356481.1 hypothetical protein [Paucibacter sp. B2R-40]
MTSPESDQTVAFLAQHLDAGASSAQIAKLVCRVCREIEFALVPIVGQRGVAALFARSLQLSAKSHHWLKDAKVGADSDSGICGGENPATSSVTPAALCTMIERQTRPEAAAGACLFLQTFCELLAKLVGRALTERLLRTPWITFLSGAAAQDNTQ